MLSNEEFAWDKKGLTDLSPIYVGEVKQISGTIRCFGRYDQGCWWSGNETCE